MRFLIPLIILSFSVLAASCKPRQDASALQGAVAQTFTLPAYAEVCRQQRVPRSPFCLEFSTQKATWHNSLVLAYLAKIAYLPPENIEGYVQAMSLDFLGNIVTESDLAVVVGGDDFIIVAFRGTDPTLRDIFKDSRTLYRPFLGGLVHAGFKAAFQALSPTLEGIYTKLSHQTRSQNVWFTGHSLGGAIARLAALDYQSKRQLKTISGIQTFGAPRSLDPVLAQRSQNMAPSNIRFVRGNDIVTNLPGPVFFRHGAPVVYFEEDCSVKGLENGWVPFIKRVVQQSPLRQLVNFKGIREHSLDGYIQCVEVNTFSQSK